MQREIEVIIKGRVQMVMFRDFAKRKADNLGLYGTVENLNDNSVRIIAQGDENKLKEFIKLINKGPIFARIEKVQIKWKEIKVKFTDFKIVWT